MQIRRCVWFLVLVFATFSLFGRGHSSGGAKSVYVHGYTRKDGTYIAPHTRSAPGTASTYTAPSYTPSPAPVPLYKAPSPGLNLDPQPTRSGVAPSAFGSTYTPRRTTRSAPVYKPKKYPTSTTYRERDKHGRFVRSSAAKHQFMKKTGYPNGRPGYVVDHIMPLCRGGADLPSNMQWQTVAEAKAKDRVECR